jgi:hypothetical protein
VSLSRYGLRLVVPAAYSSLDFNPIDEAFSKIKGVLRKAEARTREALIEAIGRAITAFTERDAYGFPSTAAMAKRLNHFDYRCQRHHRTPEDSFLELRLFEALRISSGR